MMSDLIDGVAVKFGRRELIAPPLTFQALKRLKPQQVILKSMRDAGGEEFTEEQFDALVTIVHTALKRNYPNMPREEIENDLDLANCKAIMNAIMNASGLVQPGEAMRMSRPTGTTSTPIS
jgi:hypothetical protein